VLLNLPVISIFPNTIAFGNEVVHHKSNAQTITIGNPSGTPFGITSIKMAGANPGNFAQTAYSGAWRSPFRGDGDRDSELMPITIPS
jgi:hypothetical protein